MRQAAAVTANGHSTERFIELQVLHQREVFAYILTLVPQLPDAQQVLLQTNLRLWREFSDYDTSTDFLAWANRIALAEIRAHRERSDPSPWQFSDDVLEKLADDLSSLDPCAANPVQLVNSCLRQLGRQDRALVFARYSRNRTVDELATRLGCSVTAVTDSLKKIRGQIYRCVHRKIKTAEN